MQACRPMDTPPASGSLGSDESNTGHRQRRRRMRAHRNIVARRLGEKFGRESAGYFHRNKPDDLLLLRKLALMEWLRNRCVGSFRLGATRLVRAAMHLAPLLARRIRKNARCRGKLERSNRHRQHDGKQDWSRPSHKKRSSITGVARRTLHCPAFGRCCFHPERQA
jgi:hypothetical protein